MFMTHGVIEMMTQKDFYLIADRLRAMYPSPSTDAQYREGYNAALNQVAGACGASNPRFNIDLFKAACGVK